MSDHKWNCKKKLIAHTQSTIMCVWQVCSLGYELDVHLLSILTARLEALSSYLIFELIN